MLKVYSLCSGSKGNSFVIKSNDSTIMIDCGHSKKYLLNALDSINTKIEDINALLITHTHSDHISQLKLFNKIATYSLCDLDTQHYKLEPLINYSIANFIVTPLPLSHDATNTCGYIIEKDQEKIVYITDTGYVKQEYIPLIRDANCYIIEFNHDVELLMQSSRPYYLKKRILGDTGHLCNSDGANLVRECITSNTNTIWLAHISEDVNNDDLAINTLKNLLTKKELETIKVIALKQHSIIRKE